MAVKRKLREEHEKSKQAAAVAAAAAAAKAASTDAADASKPSVVPAAPAAPAEDEGRAAAAQADDDSPFACISATMGYDTFHLVQMLWLGVIDLPTNSSEKDWDLQVRAPPP